MPQSVAEILRERVVLEVECLDRVYLNGYVPSLQTEGAVAKFIRDHLGLPIASTAAIAPMTEEFVRKVHAFAQAQHLDLVSFEKDQRKDDVMKQYLAEFQRTEGVLFIGRAQEKARVFRTVQKKNPQTGRRYPWIIRGSAMPNSFYFYLVDEDFGPLFLKFCSYFPYAMKVCLNGHEWVKRQLAKEGIAFTALDNGILWCENPVRLQELCHSLDQAKIAAVVGKWLERLPHPFEPKDQAAGYAYALSILQAEFSLTQVFDLPRTGRQFFEEIIRENIDLGRPEQVQLLFQRRISRRTPCTFRTRILTQGVVPSLHVQYKRSRIKQYHKEGRALRTETTINNTYDFGIGRALKNLPALRRIGFAANRRLLDVQTLSHDCTIGEAQFTSVLQPTVQQGQKGAALRFGDPRVQALMHALCLFVLLPTGFRNDDLRQLLCPLLGVDPADYTPGKMTYDLRRLRLHGLIRKRPRTHRYELTPQGLRTALFFSRAHARFFRVAFAGPTLPQPDTSLPRRARTLHNAARAVDRLIEEARLAA
jgi:hypothetical protein